MTGSKILSCNSIFRVANSCFHQFHEVLALIEDDIAKDGSTSRRVISSKEQLMATLHHLAGGESHKTLALFYDFMIKPRSSGSSDFNYKQLFLLNLITTINL